MDGFFIMFLPMSVLLIFFIVKSAGRIAECSKIMSLGKWISGNYVGRIPRHRFRFIYNVNGVEYVHELNSILFLQLRRAPVKVFYDPSDPKRSCIKKLSVRGHIEDIVLCVMLLIVIFVIPLFLMIIS